METSPRGQGGPPATSDGLPPGQGRSNAAWEPYLSDQLEYIRCLHRESVAEIRRLEIYALGGTVAVWSWLATGDRLATFSLAAWLPVLLVHLLGIRALGLFHFAQRAARHLKTVEASLGVPPHLRWESDAANPRLMRLRALTGQLYWLILSPLTFALAADHLWFHVILQQTAGH